MRIQIVFLIFAFVAATNAGTVKEIAAQIKAYYLANQEKFNIQEPKDDAIQEKDALADEEHMDAALEDEEQMKDALEDEVPEEYIFTYKGKTYNLGDFKKQHK
eukprot:superscaffoldBa00001743_g11836